MRTRSTLLFCSIACAFMATAQAGVHADEARTTNGGTGFIGVTESAGTAWRPDRDLSASASGTSSVPLRAGEASTFVDGQPNQQPVAPGSGMSAPDTRAMGAAPAMRADAAPAWGHRMWGTPD
jgi:hypothetical protein